MEELIIEFGNDTLGETRMYQRNLKGYEQAVKDLKLYKAQQKAEIDYLKSQIKSECKEHQEAMKVALTYKQALKLVCQEYSKLYCKHYCHREPCEACENGDYKFFKYNFLEQAEEMMKSE